MSLTGKLAVDLAKELKAAANAKTSIDEGTLSEFLDKVTVSKETDAGDTRAVRRTRRL